MVHILKISPIYFTEVELGCKTFEVRLNDRNFQKGDVIILTEFDNVTNVYTGRIISAIAGPVYKLPNMNLLVDNVCVFSLFNIVRLT